MKNWHRPLRVNQAKRPRHTYTPPLATIKPRRNNTRNWLFGWLLALGRGLGATG